MEVIRIDEEKQTTLQLVGWMDTQASSEMSDAVEGLTGDEGKLVLDLEKLEYISSSGLRQIVAAYKKMKGNMVIRNISDDVLEILKTTGLDKRLTIE